MSSTGKKEGLVPFRACAGDLGRTGVRAGGSSSFDSDFHDSFKASDRDISLGTQTAELGSAIS